MQRPLHVLVVEDEDDHFELVVATLAADGPVASVERCTGLLPALERLRRPRDLDVVLLDLGLPDAPGEDALQVLRRVLAVPGCPAVVVVTARPAELGAVAVRIGAEDYVSKDEIRSPNLMHTLEHAVERHSRVGALTLQHDRLLQVNTQLRNVAATIAHDVRSPLATAITGLLTLRESRHLLDEEARDDILDRSVTRLTDLAEQVSAILGTVTDRGTSVREEVDLRDAVTWAAEIADDQRDRLRVEVTDDSPDTLWVSVTALRQMLLNLFVNALEHNPDRLVTVRVTLEPDGADTRLVVTDDGAGFPEDVDVFEVGVSSRRHGSGLGLPTVLLQAELAGGTARRGESPDGGAGVVIVLPQRSSERLVVG